MKTSFEKLRKILYVSVGVVSLIVGIIGIFLPLLPTTCFVLLAGYCFSKGSDRLHNWILTHKYFGPPIRDWRRFGVIRVPIKCWASLMIFISALSIWLIPTVPFFVQVGTSAFFVGLVWFIWSRPHEIPPARLAVLMPVETISVSHTTVISKSPVEPR